MIPCPVTTGLADKFVLLFYACQRSVQKHSLWDLSSLSTWGYPQQFFPKGPRQTGTLVFLLS